MKRWTYVLEWRWWQWRWWQWRWWVVEGLWQWLAVAVSESGEEVMVAKR
jgi:hypothetical protein